VEIGASGPVGFNLAWRSYGPITSILEPGWAQTDVVGKVESAPNVPVAFATDLHVAAFGERRCGAARM
jgi:fructokinase